MHMHMHMYTYMTSLESRNVHGHVIQHISAGALRGVAWRARVRVVFPCAVIMTYSHESHNDAYKTDCRASYRRRTLDDHR
jgi:hypothetical protein